MGGQALLRGHEGGQEAGLLKKTQEIVRVDGTLDLHLLLFYFYLVVLDALWWIACD